MKLLKSPETTTRAGRARFTELTLLVCAAVALANIFSAGCGKRRPPQPPAESVPQRTELLSGAQRGNRVIVDVYRVAERTNDPLPLTEEEFAQRATLIGSVTYEEIRRSNETLTYADELTLTEPVRLRYAVRYVNAAGQRAAFSNFLLIEPASTVSQPPTLSEVSNPAENTVRVSWQAPAANVDGSTPVNLLGYNVYRTERSQTEPSQTPLNPAPLTRTEFNDQNFKFGETYVYTVRAVSLGTAGAQVESLNSNTLSITPRDTFAPSAPTGLSINASPQRISLFFAANPERDVVGYNVFRSTDPNLARDQWRRLTRSPTDRTTYNDDAVEPGVRYYYYVTAFDAAGNTSPPSEVVSDQIQKTP
ncbi:MAG: fibronectin type III domain-containing protein [Acidobacteria bacterium]|nr:fibronectin type III domain-containing protein [Acidobacteriota bacterium]